MSDQLNNKKIEIAKSLLEKDNALEAKSLFEEIIFVNSADYWLLKGKLEQKFQNWGESINAYQKVLEIDNQNTEAQNNLHIIQNIINFWNPEMFNP